MTLMIGSRRKMCLKAAAILPYNRERNMALLSRILDMGHLASKRLVDL